MTASARGHALPNDLLIQMWIDRLKGTGFSDDAAGLTAAAASETVDVRGMALALLGLRGHKEALPTVVAHLDDSYPPARVEAARSAALLGDGRGRTTLIALLADASWPDVAINAAAYLADLGDPAGWPVVSAALQHKEEAYRLQATLLVAAFLPFAGQEIGGARVDVVGGIEHAAVDDPSPMVRREAVIQSKWLEKKDHDRIVERAQHDPDPNVARQAQSRPPDTTPRK